MQRIALLLNAEPPLAVISKDGERTSQSFERLACGFQDASTNGTLNHGLTTTPAWSTRNEKLRGTPGTDDLAE